jgi:hypothetical protein
MTPVPKRILFARWAAAAMKISGEPMTSLPAGVVLAVPDLVEAECVEMLGEFEVSLQRQRGVGARAMKRWDEISEPQLGHGHSSRKSNVLYPTLTVIRTGCRATGGGAPGP